MTYVCDTECYQNFWLCLFRNIDTGEVLRFQKSPNVILDSPGLEAVLAGNLTIGFNSIKYDLPMIALALSGATCAELHEASNILILDGITPKEFRKLFDLPKEKYDHIDLIEVAPLSASLKIYGARLHCKTIAELPIEPDAIITKEQSGQLYTYCCNDLEVTELLYRELLPEIELRIALGKQYHKDFRSSKGSQIAEGAITSEVEKLTGVSIKRPQVKSSKFKYKIPKYIKFNSPELVDFLKKLESAEFHTNEDGEVELPKFIKETALRLGNGCYKPSIGGLHSLESCVKYD